MRLLQVSKEARYGPFYSTSLTDTDKNGGWTGVRSRRARRTVLLQRTPTSQDVILGGYTARFRPLASQQYPRIVPCDSDLGPSSKNSPGSSRDPHGMEASGNEDRIHDVSSSMIVYNPTPETAWRCGHLQHRSPCFGAHLDHALTLSALVGVTRQRFARPVPVEAWGFQTTGRRLCVTRYSG